MMIQRETWEDGDMLLTPSEVARLFRVDPKTVLRWAVAGRIRSIITPGGHHRFRQSDLREWLVRLEPGIGDVPVTPA